MFLRKVAKSIITRSLLKLGRSMLAEINVERKSGRFHTAQYTCSRAKRRAIFEPRYPVDAHDVNNAANKEGFLWLAQKTMIPKISHHLLVKNLNAVNDKSASPLLSRCSATTRIDYGGSSEFNTIDRELSLASRA